MREHADDWCPGVDGAALSVTWRSSFSVLLATRNFPSAVTTSAESRLSQVVRS